MNKFNFKKKYGQNFLQDMNIINKIVNEIPALEKDLIIEIGAGSGNLTFKLKQLNTKLIAYEIDLETEEYLNKLQSINLKIIYDDFTKRDINKDLNYFSYNNLYIVGNLPYYITTLIIKKIIDSNLNPKEMIFMVQKEVANRLAAKPGNKEYGYITVYLNYYFEIYKIFNVGKNSFMPIPKVDSSVIKFISSNKYKALDENKFFTLLKDSFQYKRKTLLNNLKKYNKKIIENILLKNNINLKVRAEQLSIEIFIEISNAL
ncbi:MAG: 16S rRNA (adenine(1518)-N(6)/adenine(1519)-N(6))-dimethyltransferase RsmA [Bacilli bacterium]|nr:16S rRNA (adenine(1518)-N(6)/adenine(1519)-N(6))-dimethyltransferase RsmA [Bacilli bacterium]MDD4406586.1 16S rRNA (adenine(1518)-N(6)/adenine(1519)-N(6))-dimethyltransferase RsmA [Bacilli bacterium]